MNEVATYSGMSPEQLMAAMGGATDNSSLSDGNRLPILKVNYHDSDDDGNKLEKGNFLLQLPSGNAYGKDVTLRVYGDHMQYKQFDDSGLVNKTIIHTMKDTPIDQNGGVRCGKPTGKEMALLGPEEKAKFSDIKNYRHLYATVSIADATNSSGETVEVKDIPCLFPLKGMSFIPFSRDVIDPCQTQRLTFQQVNCKPLTKSHKKGSVTYYTVSFVPDFANTMTLDTKDWELMAKFLDTVNAENKQILESHNKALYAKQANTNDSSMVSEVEGYLDADFAESA
tara:strand:+ start:197 stop:1045 length:849 start_codon:yes stop_codon:yes gene_type:complete